MAEKARRRLRSSTVILGGMGALAAALTSCGSEPDKRCVDRNSYDAVQGYRVVGDRHCNAGGTTGTTGGNGSSGNGSGGARGKARVDGQWYYGPEKSSGSYAGQGTFSKAQAVDRGGFGCSGTAGG
ncbi:hypothetical protein [Streptomyces sp. NPDC048644]|uniref:hypothetical protein n=1 Tax=Streptomyces sp. NPDC048644 TaxID=3365582 RepID=UPI00371CAB89